MSPSSGTDLNLTLALTNDAILSWQWQPVWEPVVDNAAGASGVTYSTAWLNGTLISTGQAPTTASIYWGAADGSTNKTAWFSVLPQGVLSLGAFSNLVGGLYEGMTYYYRCYASNADTEVWAPASSSFTTLTPYASLRSRMKVSFPGYDRPETLTNFPVLLVLSNNVGGSGFDYGGFLSTNGYDLRFRDGPEDKELNYEVERWDPGGSSYVWVQVPQLSSNSFIRATWGDAADSGQLSCTTNGATWSEGFEAVWHFNEDPEISPVIRDSSSKRHDGISSNLLSGDQVPGLGGGSLSFDGATKFITLNSELTMPASGAFTLSAWVRPLPSATAYPGVTARATTPGYNDSLRLFAGTPRLNIAGSAKVFSTPTVKDGVTWSYWAGTRASGSPGVVTLFQNGTNDTASASSTTAIFSIAYLGRGLETNDTSRNWKGGLDEIRVSEVARSTNWIWAEWLNMSSNAVFNSYGAVTAVYPLALTAAVSASNLVLRWPSLSGPAYDVERASNLPGVFSIMASNLPATPPLNTFTDRIPGTAAAFYRVRSK